MKSRQRRAKQQRAKGHQVRQQERLAKALRDSEALMNTDKHTSFEGMMERCGYLRNSNGGWRRIRKQRNNTIDKE
jgi:hypothetical protein